jgi:hypothetical protein
MKLLVDEGRREIPQPGADLTTPFFS